MEEVEEREAGERMSRIDQFGAAALLVLGLVVAYFSWTMPRLENRGVHPLTIPGLVPGALGLVLAACAFIVLLRALRRDRMPWRAFVVSFLGTASLRVAVVILLALIYTLGLVGWLPFWAATGVFVFAFILIFEVWLSDVRRPLLRSLPWAAAIAIGTAIAVTLVFERAFLVRLP